MVPQSLASSTTADLPTSFALGVPGSLVSFLTRLPHPLPPTLFQYQPDATISRLVTDVTAICQPSKGLHTVRRGQSA
jgi:hypothetical protein